MADDLEGAIRLAGELSAAYEEARSGPGSLAPASNA